VILFCGGLGMVAGGLFGLVLGLLSTMEKREREHAASLQEAKRETALWESLYQELRDKCEDAELKLELHESSAIIEAAFQSIEGE